MGDTEVCNRNVLSHVGERHGRLTVVGIGVTGFNEKLPDGSVRRHPRRYECACDCGTILFRPLSALSSGNTKSCGCITRTANGRGNDPEYKVWKEMIRRCTDERHRRYAEWGGRGISVCDRWLIYDNFIADMGARPGDGYSIERRDNDLGYAPNNCYWATAIEQGNNKSSNRMLTYMGKTQSMMNWSRELGVNYYSLRSRVHILGWSDERALSTSVRSRNG